MKKILFLTILLAALKTASAQVEAVVVETYYISDSLDATDTTGGTLLIPGSKTYRVYIDLAEGNKLRKIFGDDNHRLIISSTADFYNNKDRPSANFGYLINKSWFHSNPTLALDSWLTLGLATKTQNGVLKNLDTDGSIIGGLNNNGGSSGIPGGILVNADPGAGTALTATDGLMLNDSVLSQWIDYGIKDLNGDDTTIFGTLNSGSLFAPEGSIYLQQNSGVSGHFPASNQILVAQLTTTGAISFELNIEVELNDGTIVQYVANGDTLINDPSIFKNEQLSPYLKYPAVCGCDDPSYLEYNAAFACGEHDSCKTLIVFGCMDSAACNFNPDANYHVAELCCYPGNCNDRDIETVCPGIGGIHREMQLLPNPAGDHISFLIDGDPGLIIYEIYNSFGKLECKKQVSFNRSHTIDLTGFSSGIYIINVVGDNLAVSKSFYKY